MKIVVLDGRTLAPDRSAWAGLDRLGELVLHDFSTAEEISVRAAGAGDPDDLLFIDADKQGYLDYLTKLLPLVRPGGLIVAHNNCGVQEPIRSSSARSAS